MRTFRPVFPLICLVVGTAIITTPDACAQADAHEALSPEQLRGRWAFSIDVPPQPITGELALAQVAGVLQGRLTTDNGQYYRLNSVDIDGSSFLFEVEIPEHGRVHARGTVAGQAFSGQVQVSGEGAYSWSGSRQKEVFSTYSQLQHVRADDAAREVVDRHVPGLLDQIPPGAPFSLRDIAAYTGQFSEEVLKAIDDELAAL